LHRRQLAAIVPGTAIFVAANWAPELMVVPWFLNPPWD
jgi:hypothetical protein